MLFESSSLDSISGWVMIIGSKIICLSSEHYTIEIFWSVFTSFRHSTHVRCISILNQCTSETLKVNEHTAWWTAMISGGIDKISSLPLWQICQSFVHLTSRTWNAFQAISVPHCWISGLVISANILARHLKSPPGFFVGLIPYPPKGAINTDQAWHSAIGTVL